MRTLLTSCARLSATLLCLMSRVGLVGLAIALTLAGCASNDASNATDDAGCPPQEEGETVCTHCGGGYKCVDGKQQAIVDFPCDQWSAACDYMGCKTNCSARRAHCHAVDAGWCPADGGSD